MSRTITDAARWRFCVEHDFPSKWQQLHPRKRPAYFDHELTGRRHFSTAAGCVDAAMEQLRQRQDYAKARSKP